MKRSCDWNQFLLILVSFRWVGEKFVVVFLVVCLVSGQGSGIGRCGPAFENSWFGGHSPRFPSVLSPYVFFPQPPKDRNVESHIQKWWMSPFQSFWVSLHPLIDLFLLPNGSSLKMVQCQGAKGDVWVLPAPARHPKWAWKLSTSNLQWTYQM